MATIDIGPGASSDLGGNSGPEYTSVALGNPANDTGILTSFEIWMRTDGTGVKMGTFYGSDTTYTNRDYENIGNVTSGSKQTFTGKSCSVQTGDYIGRYASTGNTSAQTSGGSGMYYISGDKFGAGETSGYTAAAAFNISLYATGTTESASGWTHITKADGVTASGLSKKNGIAVGSVAKVDGVAV